MSRKPTYEELIQRVKALKKEAAEHKRAEELLQESEERYRTIIEGANDGIAIVQGDRHVYVNKRFVEIFGYDRPTEVIGKPISMRIHPDDLERVVQITKCRQRGEEAPSRYESKGTRKDGSLIYLEVSANRIMYHGTPASLVFFRDVTERKQAEQVLRERESRYSSLVESTEDSIYSVDGSCKYLFINAKHLSRFGLSADKGIGRSYGEFHTEEETKMFEKSIKEVFRTGKPLSQEYRSKRDGRHFFRSLTPVRSFQGRISAVTVISKDITVRKRAEDALRYERDYLEKVLENSADAIAIVDEKGRFTRWNKRAEEMCGFSFEELKGKSAFELYVDKNGLEKMLRELRGQNFIRDYETALKKKDGGTIPVALSISVLKDDYEQNIGSICVARDLTERKKMEEQLKYLSLHDSLTGLYNRNYFEQEMHRLSDGRYAPIGIIVCDVDGLKLINDTFGHESGDAILIATGETIKRCFRNGDVVARIGGDEFAVLLRSSDKEIVESATDRIRKAVANYNAKNPRLPLNLSVGTAVSNHKSLDMKELFKEADSNMYRDKLHHLQSARSSVVHVLAKALEARDFITEGHAERLQDLVVDLAVSLQLPDYSLNDLRLLAQFHDIGKVGISDHILFKPGPLTPQETKEMRRHCEIGYRIAQSTPDLAPIADWILKHHEWWNGAGYPLGLKGEEIPLECRILAIADAYDAMTSDLPYREAMSYERAIAELRKYAGTQFDPQLVERFIEVLDKRQK